MTLPRRNPIRLSLPTKGVLAATFIWAGIFSNAWGQGSTKDSQKMLDKSFTSSVGAVKYLLHVPKNYEATKRYPLVVSLRGAGSTYVGATDNFEIAHPWIEDSIQTRVPHFILVPECNDGSWGGLAGSASNGVMAAASKAVMEIVEDLKKQYSLDTNRFIHRRFRRLPYHRIEAEFLGRRHSNFGRRRHQPN
jgi:poly(3-hydroxybutyrate) depolymerase